MNHGTQSPVIPAGAPTHEITEARLLELGEAERRLEWAIGTVQDYVSGRPGVDVFEELILTLTADKFSHDPANDPLPLTVAQVLNQRRPGYK